jgi:putative transposase
MLTLAERQLILDVAHEPRFADVSVPEIYASLLDEGRYLGSLSTFYRVLHGAGEVHERRRHATHPPTIKPELCAMGPNEVWSWDITRLRGPQKWSWFYLYVILDVFSRYVVGWMVADRESSELASELIAASIQREGIIPGTLTIHADRGSSMASKPVAFLLADLGVTKSHSRPRTCNDNPYSEAQFKTLKYHPTFPPSFANLEDARRFCRSFFGWYNAEHHHSALALLTPADVHHGLVTTRLENRNAVLLEAWRQHPERFVRGRPTVPSLALPVYINRPNDSEVA